MKKLLVIALLILLSGCQKIENKTPEDKVIKTLHFESYILDETIRGGILSTKEYKYITFFAKEDDQQYKFYLDAITNTYKGNENYIEYYCTNYDNVEYYSKTQKLLIAVGESFSKKDNSLIGCNSHETYTYKLYLKELNQIKLFRS